MSDEEKKALLKIGQLFNFKIDSNRLREVTDKSADDIAQHLGKQEETDHFDYDDDVEDMDKEIDKGINVQSLKDSGMSDEAIQDTLKYNQKFNHKINTAERKWKKEKQATLLDQVFENLSISDDSKYCKLLKTCVDSSKLFLENVTILFLASPNEDFCDKTGLIIHECLSQKSNAPETSLSFLEKEVLLTHKHQKIVKLSIEELIDNTTRRIFFSGEGGDQKQRTRLEEDSIFSPNNSLLSMLFLQNLYTGFEFDNCNHETKGDVFVRDLRTDCNNDKIDQTLFPLTLSGLSGKVKNMFEKFFGKRFWPMILTKEILKHYNTSTPNKLLVIVTNVKQKEEILIPAHFGAKCLFLYLELPLQVLHKRNDRVSYAEKDKTTEQIKILVNQMDMIIGNDISTLSQQKGDQYKRHVPSESKYEEIFALQWKELKTSQTELEIPTSTFMRDNDNEEHMSLTEGEILEHLKNNSSSSGKYNAPKPRKKTLILPVIEQTAWDIWKTIYVKHYMRENFSDKFLSNNMSSGLTVLSLRLGLNNTSYDSKDGNKSVVPVGTILGDLVLQSLVTFLKMSSSPFSTEQNKKSQ